MKRLSQLAVVVVVLAAIVTPALADTLVLKTGTRVSGYFEGGTARIVKFRGTDGIIRDYDIGAVQQVLFEDVSTPAAASQPSTPVPAPAASTATSTSEPRLRPASERPPAQPVSAGAAATGYTVPTGS